MFPTGRDFEQMALNTDTGILIHEAASKNILWANPAACRMFGLTLDELRPLKAHHMSAQEQQYRRAVGVAWLAEAATHGKSRRQWKYRRPDGHEFLTDAVATRIELEDGPAVMVQFRGIDEEMEVREELQRATGYLERIMAYASAGIVLLDEDNRVRDTSPFAARLFGLPHEQVAGELLEDVVSIDPPLGEEHSASALATHGVPLELRLAPRHANEQRWLSGHLENVAHDGIQSRMLVVRDITSKVELEAEAALREGELQRLGRENAMGDMAMIIAHELGQPLAATNNFLRGVLARMDAREVSEPDLRFGLTHAVEQLARASRIVASVKRHVERTESTPNRTDLTEVVRESLYFVELAARDRGVRVHSDLTKLPLPIRAEQVLLGQVVLNLCRNAIEETASLPSPNRHLRVSTFRDGPDACCSVIDAGRGISLEETWSRRGFSTKPGGGGIGLMLCERILDRHGGELELAPLAATEQGTEPRGTKAVFRIPISDDDAEPA